MKTELRSNRPICKGDTGNIKLELMNRSQRKNFRRRQRIKEQNKIERAKNEYVRLNIGGGRSICIKRMTEKPEIINGSDLVLKFGNSKGTYHYLSPEAAQKDLEMVLAQWAKIPKRYDYIMELGRKRGLVGEDETTISKERFDGLKNLARNLRNKEKADKKLQSGKELLPVIPQRQDGSFIFAPQKNSHKQKLQESDIKFFKQVYGTDWHEKYKIFLKERRQERASK